MKQHFIVPVKHRVGLWVLWTSCDQGDTLFILCVDDPLYPILALLLFYSWDLLIHYEGWMETRESIRRRFLCWRSISGVWPIVMLQSARRGFASAEVFISFFACVTCFRCLSAYWWLFAPWHCNMHQLKIKKKKNLLPSFLSSLDCRIKLRPRKNKTVESFRGGFLQIIWFFFSTSTQNYEFIQT